MGISSIGGIAQAFPMEGMRPPQGSPPGGPAERAEALASEIAGGSGGDGLLSAGKLDSDKDGLLSPEGLRTGIQSRMEEAQSGFGSGTMPSEDNREFMEQIHALAGEEMVSPPRQSQAKAQGHIR